MSDGSIELVKVHIDLPNHWWQKGESVWAKCLEDNLYRIESVPICAYGLNYGDVVLAIADGADLEPKARSVVRRGGHRTLRFSFCDRLTMDQQQAIIAAVALEAGKLERVDAQFVCIDIPPNASYDSIRNLLIVQEGLGALEYETCEERVPGSFDDRPALQKPADGA